MKHDTLPDDVMTLNKSIFKVALLCLVFLSTTVMAGGSSIRVVTSFSILEDLVNELGGEYVNVLNLVGRNSDAHIYQPKPSDAVAIANAELVVFNGLEFEGWISRLIENAEYKNKQLVASIGVDAITFGEEVDPHAWQSFHNIRIYIENITQSLMILRPEHTKKFIQNKQRYLHSITVLENKLLEQIEKIPQDNRIVVTSHDAFGYLGREFNIRFLSPVGLNIEIEASAEDVAAVIDKIRAQQVGAIFMENISNPRLLQRIADETDIAIGGSLYSDALSEVNGPASTYLHMMRHNIESLIISFSTI